MPGSMKRTALVLLMLAALSSLLYAQKNPSRQAGKVASIEIAGVKLHLGMTKADVAERFVGIQISKVTEELWAIDKGGNSQLKFKNGRLVSANHSWINTGDDQMDALFAVVSLLNREGYSACKISTDTKVVPTTDADTGRIISAPSAERVWIDCGQKSVLIIKITFNGRRTAADVVEQLGDFVEDPD